MVHLLSRGEIMEWRKEFPILNKTIHLGNCSQSPISTRVQGAIAAYTQSLVETGMAWGLWMERVNGAKAEFARLINADVDEVSVTMSVSDATAAIATSLKPNSERYKVVTTEVEFPTIGQIWLANKQRGLEVSFIPPVCDRLDLQSVAEHVDKHTLLLSTTHVSYQTGARHDIRGMAEIAHSNGALIYVDAYQSLGTIAVDVKRDDVDFLASGTLKYLLGIPGIAFLYAKRELADILRPSITGWFGQENPFAMENMRLDYARGTRRFDTGTPPVLAAYVAEAGLSIINEVGIERIQSRIEELVEFTLGQVRHLGLKLMGPGEAFERGAAVALAVADSHMLEQALMERGVIASARGPALRLVPHFFTLEEEIEEALGHICELLALGS